MKNIHVLPTDKPSRLNTYKGVLNLAAGEFVAPTIVKNDLINQTIYITSDEDVNENDYIITKDGRLIQVSYLLSKDLEGCSKIILTTDTDLIQDGVQAIDDEFLEWFVNNPSCEEVEVREIEVEDYVGFAGHTSYPTFHKEYKTIIPKKEPKQEQEVCNRCGKTLREQMKGCGEITCYRQFLPKQEKLTYTESAKKEERISNCIMMKSIRETLEEAAEKEYPTIHEQYQYDAFIEGAKWQMDKQSDFIIGFLEFIEGTYSYSNIFDHWYLHANTSKTYSKKQLLEVYLKRNKL